MNDNTNGTTYELLRANNYSYRIRDARKKAGLTQEQLADKTGLSLSTIRAYETGKRNPKADSYIKIGAACGVSSAVLMGVRDDLHENRTSREALFNKLVDICNNAKLITGTEEQTEKLQEMITFENEQIEKFSKMGFAPTKEKLEKLDELQKEYDSLLATDGNGNIYANTLGSVIAMLQPLNTAGLLEIMQSITKAQEIEKYLYENEKI